MVRTRAIRVPRLKHLFAKTNISNDKGCNGYIHKSNLFSSVILSTGFPADANVQEEHEVPISTISVSSKEPKQKLLNIQNEDISSRDTENPSISKSISDRKIVPAFGIEYKNEPSFSVANSQPFGAQVEGSVANSPPFGAQVEGSVANSPPFGAQVEGSVANSPPFGAQVEGSVANSPPFGAQVEGSVANSPPFGAQVEGVAQQGPGLQSGFQAPFEISQQQPAFDASFQNGQQQPNFDTPFQSQQQNNQQGFDVPLISYGETGTRYNVGQTGNTDDKLFGSGPTVDVNAPDSGLYDMVFDSSENDFYLRTALSSAGLRPSRYTALDLAKVDFETVRNSGFKEYITVRENDGSGEREIYRLIGVAPAAAVQGGAATSYSANIANGVPVYSELDDDDDTVALTRFISSQPNFYSAQGSESQPINVRAEAAISGNNFVLLLDD